MQLTGNLAENWKRFKQRFNIYLAASGAGGDDEKLKASILLHKEKMLLTESQLTLTALVSAVFRT